MSYQLHPVPALKDNYIWVLSNLENQQALVVDPGESEPVIHYLQSHNLQLAYIFVTHHHSDHSHGISALKNQYQVPVYGGKASQLSSITHGLADGEVIDLPELALSFRAIAVPGHTLDHTTFYSAPYAFTGDTLFSAGCGRVFEGTPEMMWTSLQKLLQLPLDTNICCGHEYTLNNLRFAQLVEPHSQAITEYLTNVEALINAGKPTLPSTLALEKQVNPFLRVKAPEVIQRASEYAEKTLSEPWEVFAALRDWKNTL